MIAWSRSGQFLLVVGANNMVEYRAVENAILIVEFARQLRAQGRSIRDAAASMKLRLPHRSRLEKLKLEALRS
jgi:hypothetical protein